MTVAYDEDRGVYFDAADPVLDLDYFWTAFCGGHGEEIDVVARNVSEARAITLAAIAADYDPISIDHIERRHRGVVYF